MPKEISGGTVHSLSPELKRVLAANKAALTKWETLTPLARNEWICWVESVKKPETRRDHIDRVCSELVGGRRRPCCWLGCTHRKDKELSPSQKYILGKRKQ